MNHILAICDVEETYASKLADYMNLKEGFPFLVRSFSSIDNLIFFARQQTVEVVLVSYQFKQILQKENIVNCIIELGEHTKGDCAFINKYQSGEMIMRELLQILAEDENSYSHVFRATGMKLIGLYSPIKRSLQTTFGLTLGQLLAKRGKVLYINLEGFSGLNIMLQKNFQKDLSDLLYYMKNGKQGLAYILGSMVESVNGMDILPPMLCQIDLISIEGREWLKLFYEIEKYSDYEYLILDLSDSVQGLFEILRQCSVIYTMTDQDGFAMAKIDQYERMLEQCKYEDIIQKTNKCELPKFSYLPPQLDRLTICELAETIRELLKEDVYAVR